MHYWLERSRIQKIVTIPLLAVLFAAVFFGALFAQDFTQGYDSDTTLVRGSIVAISPDDNNKVEPINNQRIEEMFGVVVRSNDSAVTLSTESSGAYVATSGRFEVLVSSANGPISSGDFITLSSITGIGMKADSRQKLVLGKALQDIDFSNADQILSQSEAVDSEGNSLQVSIGRILVEVSIGANPNSVENQSAPDFLINFSETVTGEPVSALRIYAGLAVLLIASSISGSLLYSAVRSSIISIGRNPLSKKSVLTGLAQVIVISLIIFFSGLFAVYLILIL